MFLFLLCPRTGSDELAPHQLDMLSSCLDSLPTPFTCSLSKLQRWLLFTPRKLSRTVLFSLLLAQRFRRTTQNDARFDLWWGRWLPSDDDTSFAVVVVGARSAPLLSLNLLVP
jgi:hypothetical protein